MAAEDRSLPPREAWIEILCLFDGAVSRRSLPPREAWIEMDWPRYRSMDWGVASPAGSVD